MRTVVSIGKRVVHPLNYYMGQPTIITLRVENEHGMYKTARFKLGHGWNSARLSNMVSSFLQSQGILEPIEVRLTNVQFDVAGMN